MLLFSKLGISFLQNSLLLADQYSSSIMSAEDILEKSSEQLLSMTLSKNLLIWGGIGFSAYNEKYNATKGIYDNTITSLKSDLRYTKESECVYNKLCETFFSEKLIIYHICRRAIGLKKNLYQIGPMLTGIHIKINIFSQINVLYTRIIRWDINLKKSA